VEGSTVPSLRLSHVGLCVADLDRAVAFYRDAIGMVERTRLKFDGEPSATLLGIPDVEIDLVYLERDGLRLELIGYRRSAVDTSPAPRPMNATGFTHLSVFVADSDTLVERIETCGGRVLRETEVLFERGNRGVMAVDPDGTRVELIEEASR
jgi:catechol 2,3-dioxygenase-like lactoylglutathione lyase family enzyme